MKPDFRISVKDYSRQKNLKVELARVPFARQFWVRMNGAKWPADTGVLHTKFAGHASRLNLMDGNATAKL